MNKTLKTKEGIEMTKEEIKEVLAGFTNEEGVTDLDAASEEINKLIVAEEGETSEVTLEEQMLQAMLSDLKGGK